MEYEKEYLEMMRDTSNLVAKEKAMQLGEIASATNESAKLANEVEFGSGWELIIQRLVKYQANSASIDRKGKMIAYPGSRKGY